MTYVLAPMSGLQTGMARTLSVLSTIFFIGLQFGCSTYQPFPDIAQEFSRRGQVRLATDSDYNGAIEDFTRAIEFNPQDSTSYLGRAIARQKLGYVDSAREDYRAAVSLNPSLAAVIKPFQSMP